MYPKSNHLVEIDYLRGLAISLTLIAHLAAMQTIPSPLYIFIINNVAQFWGGVILFFTISGFVISRNFMDKFSYTNTPTEKAYKAACKKFYLRRFYRIVPTAITWILITVFLSFKFNKYGSFGNIKSITEQAFAATFFIYNLLTPWIAGPALSIYWSLSFEEQFYLIFPFLSRLNIKLKLFILLSVISLFFLIHRPADQNRLITSLPLDAICYGVLIALIQKSQLATKIKPSFLRREKFSNLNFIISISIIIFSPIVFKNIMCGTSILVFSGAWLVFCASYDCKFISPPYFIKKLLQHLGKASFSLYCCHKPAYLMSKEIAFHIQKAYSLKPPTLNFIALSTSIILCLIFTLLSLSIIEKPTRRLGRIQSQKRNNILPLSPLTP